MIKNNYFLFILLTGLIISTSILLFVGPELILQRLSIFPTEIKKNEIGDAFGGTLGPIIAWIASILTFAAFWVQFKANQQQKLDLQVERFENKFYSMVQILRENVSEITIGESLEGRKSFISMFNELKFLYLFSDQFFNNPNNQYLIESSIGKDSLSKHEIFNISYLIFFFGIGQNSNKLLLNILDNKYEILLVNLEKELEEIQIKHRRKGECAVIEKTNNGEAKFILKLSYAPFDGHLSRLSHYIRHLFQLIKFINDQQDDVLNYEAKYDYASTVRAQLSAHEQLLLYYNALSVLGKPWLENDNNLLRKYCMVKSIPLPLADFYLKPNEVLPELNDEGKVMFEWVEIKKRMDKL